MKFVRLITLAAIVAATTAAYGQIAEPPVNNITVVINNAPVTFQGAPPQQVNGSVLVPLRGVFEQLGASVNYVASTRTIEAIKGATDVVLRLGQDTAYVNGNAEPLAQPPVVINGTTLVPLRFVAESFGAAVQWNGPTQTVNIKTSSANVAALPSTPTDQNGNVIGQLTGVYTDTNPPQVTIRVNGRNTSVPVTSDTVILVQRGSDPAVQSELSALQVGDQVRVTRRRRMPRHR